MYIDIEAGITMGGRRMCWGDYRHAQAGEKFSLRCSCSGLFLRRNTLCVWTARCLVYKYRTYPELDSDATGMKHVESDTAK